MLGIERARKGDDEKEEEAEAEEDEDDEVDGDKVEEDEEEEEETDAGPSPEARTEETGDGSGGRVFTGAEDRKSIPVTFLSWLLPWRDRISRRVISGRPTDASTKHLPVKVPANTMVPSVEKRTAVTKSPTSAW